MEEQVDVSVSNKEWDPDWDAFVESAPHGHHVQTSLWGLVKSTLGYHSYRIIVSKKGNIVAGGQLLIKQLFPYIAISYMPKGPIFPQEEPSFVATIFSNLKHLVRSHHIQLLVIQPPTEYPEFTMLLNQHRFQPGWLDIAPTATILLDLTPDFDQILARMKRQTRQNIHRSAREGIVVREGNQDDLPAFYHLHLTTSQRQKFSPYPEQYFTSMWRSFAPHNYIKLIIAEFESEPVSALLLIPFGDTVIAKTLGWSGQYAERRPNDAVFWASIQWAKTHGYRCFDFEGIDRRGAEIMMSGQPLPENLQHSPDFFKLGYGGLVSLPPKPYDLIINPFIRWPYQYIFGKADRGLKANAMIDRFRRRFG